MRKAGASTGTAPIGTEAQARQHLSPHVRQILDQFRLDTIVSHLMRRAHFTAEDMFARQFGAEGITPRQKATLIIVYQNPGINQSELAKQLHMDRNTVAELVRRLVSVGVLTRLSAQEDQRAYCLFLAPAGFALLERVMPADIALEEQLLQRLPAEYRALFVKCLKLIVSPSEPE